MGRSAMKAMACSFLLAILLTGCAGEEKTQMNTGRVIPSDTGKCTQTVGTRTFNVECPK